MNWVTATRHALGRNPSLRSALAFAVAPPLAYATAEIAYRQPSAVFIVVAAVAALSTAGKLPIRYLALALAARPLIDTLWHVKFNVGGVTMNLQRLWGFALPLAFMALLSHHALKGSEREGTRLPRGFLWGTLAVWALFFASSARHGRGAADIVPFFFKVYCNLLWMLAGFVFCRTREFGDNFLKAFLLFAATPVGVAVGQGLGFLPQQLIVEEATNTTANFLSAIDPDAQRLAGLYYDPGSLVVVLQTGIAACLYVLSSKQSVWWRRFAWAMLLGCLFAMKNSYLRQGWASAVVMIGGWMALRRRFGEMAIGGVLLLAVVLYKLDYFAAVFAGVYEIFFERDPKKIGYLWSGRIGAWMDFGRWFVGEADWRERLFGGGLGLVIEGYRPMSNPHNQAIYLMMHVGVVGLAAFAWTLVSCLGAVWPEARLSRSDERDVVGAQTTLLLFGTFLFMCVGSQPLYQFNLVGPTFLLAGWMARMRQERQLDAADERRTARLATRGEPAPPPLPAA